MEELIKTAGQRAAEFLFEFAVSLLIIFISFRLISILSRKAEKKLLKHKKYDKTVVKTLIYLTRSSLKLLILIALVGYLGIDTSGFAALITSLGVGVGLAVNGALSNFAGGAILLMTRPFEVDDYIESEGFSGTVEEIRVISTRLRTPDNKTIFIPNGTLSSSTIINYSRNQTRRVDLIFRISAEEDPSRAKELIRSVILSDPNVLKDEEISIRIKAQGKAYVPIIVRVWVRTADYWTVYFDLTEGVKDVLDRSGFSSLGEYISVENE